MMTKLERQTIIILLIVAGILATGWMFKATLASIRKSVAEKNPERDTSKLAVLFRQAFNPSGLDWMIDIDTTDVEAVMALAEQSKGIFNEVSKNYKGRYGKALDEQLKDELNSAELTQFYQILNA